MRIPLQCAALLLFLLPGISQALPPMESPLDRARNSDVVIHAVITAQQQTALNSVVSAIQLSITVQGTLKSPANFKAKKLTSLNFLITPGSYESGLREAPGPGHWIIFLRLKEQTVDNRSFIIPVLYSPEAFAFHPFDEKLSEEIRNLP
ncbi:MAG: hypothetical protein RH862_10240 [Leptospiraceae bacterium]